MKLKLILKLVVLIGITPAFSLYAESLSIIYPYTNRPSHDLIKQIITGVEKEFSGKIDTISLGKEFNSSAVANAVLLKNNDYVITLGRKGFAIAEALQSQVPVATGAFLTEPSKISGISSHIDPEVMLTYLLLLAPNIKKVHIVYQPKIAWLIEYAKEQAAKLNIELISYSVVNVKSAIEYYDMIFQQLNPKTEAVWLPADSISTNKEIILPRLLKYAWTKKVILFSSLPIHVKRGALFSVFPSHEMIGKKLVHLVKRLAMTKKTQFELLKDVVLVVNPRASSHLGYKYSKKQQRRLGITFIDSR